jgi:hypothetical protein
MCAAVNIHPIDPLRGPLVETIVDGDTWTSQPWNNLTHRACTIYVSSDQYVTLFVDHAPGSTDLVGSPISSMHSVVGTVPASFHEKLDGRVSQIRIQNASGSDATVTVDVILRPTAEDHASTRLTLDGVDVSYGNPLPVSGTISNAVEVSQWDATSLNATVTQAGTVNVASASTLDTRQLTSATDAVSVSGTVLVNPGGISLPATVFQDDPSELQATVTQAGTVSVEGLEMQVATILSPNNTATYPITAACRVYGVYYAHASSNTQNLALYDATSGVVSGSTRKFSLMAAAGDLTMVVPGGGYVSFSNGVAVRSTTTVNPSSTSGSSTDTMAVVFYRLVV